MCRSLVSFNVNFWKKYLLKENVSGAIFVISVWSFKTASGFCVMWNFNYWIIGFGKNIPKVCTTCATSLPAVQC